MIEDTFFSETYYSLEGLLNELSFAYEKLTGDEYDQAICDVINGLDSLLGKMQAKL